VAHFAKLPAGIHVLLGLDSGLNKVDVAKKEARIKTQQTDQRKELKDQFEQDKQPSQSYVPGLDEILEKHQEVFALEKRSAASNLPPVEIELLPGASPMRVPSHHMSAEDEQILEEEVKEMLDKGIVERVKSSKWVFPFFIARGKSRSLRRKAKKSSAVDFRRLNPWLKVIEYPFPVKR